MRIELSLEKPSEAIFETEDAYVSQTSDCSIDYIVHCTLFPSHIILLRHS